MIIDTAQQHSVDLDGVEPGIACRSDSGKYTSGSRRRRASWAKVSGSSVSSEMLIRLRPAAASFSARAARPIPFVVRAMSGTGESRDISDEQLQVLA